MTWLRWHEQSEKAAAEAEVLLRRGETAAALDQYRIAAKAEAEALHFVSPDKMRTFSITLVSATALWFKAREYAAAEALALDGLKTPNLPRYATEELRSLVQTLWMKEAMASTEVQFLPGQVTVSVSGGETVAGGAPLELIVSKVQAVQSIFFRLIEMAKLRPHRSRGQPPADIQAACRPWLFQAAPGSYQFSVAVQQPKEPDFFEIGVEPLEVATRFLEILRASRNPEVELREAVPDAEYRETFLKLVRNLAPNGKSIGEIEVRSAESSRGTGVVISAIERKEISRVLRKAKLTPSDSEAVELHGVLRALHLDSDWLEVLVNGESIKVTKLSSTVDDVIGPMVNKRVTIQTLKRNGSYTFLDIESDD